MVSRTKARSTKLAIRLYIVCRSRACGFSGSTFAQTTRMMKKGEVKIWMMTSQRFHSLGSVEGCGCAEGEFSGSCSGEFMTFSSVVISSCGGAEVAVLWEA